MARGARAQGANKFEGTALLGQDGGTGQNGSPPRVRRTTTRHTTAYAESQNFVAVAQHLPRAQLPEPEVLVRVRIEIQP